MTDPNTNISTMCKSFVECCVIQTNSRTTALSPANFEVKLPVSMKP